MNRDEKNQHGFTTALIGANSINERKRLSTLADETEPARKKFQSNNGSRNESMKSVNDRHEAVENIVKPQVRYENKSFVDERCLTGNVSQILTFNKKLPNLEAFYEVYGKFTIEALLLELCTYIFSG